MRRLLVTLVVVSAICSAAAAGPPPTDAAIAHLLNRISFGPRPADVERVRAIGIERYVDEQLHPERIADTALTERLAGLTTVRLSQRDIVDTFELPQIEARRERKQNAAPGADPNAAPSRDPMAQKANTLVDELA